MQIKINELLQESAFSVPGTLVVAVIGMRPV